MDIYDILGPVMVGPSSSHTAGAARIGAMARTLLGEEVADAKLHLYGSFAETGKGHGTDRALVAGLLGMKPDDLRIPNAFEEAKKAGLRYTIDEIDLRDAHPNTAVLELTGKGGRLRFATYRHPLAVFQFDAPDFNLLRQFNRRGALFSDNDLDSDDGVAATQRPPAG